MGPQIEWGSDKGTGHVIIRVILTSPGEKGMRKGSKDTWVALAGCYLSLSSHAQRITPGWGKYPPNRDDGRSGESQTLSLNDSRHPLLLCGCRIHSFCGGGYYRLRLYCMCWWYAPVFCSANRAPTRSECFKNLSTQFIMHCSCLGISYSSWGEGIETLLTSFDDKALLVKSLQHDVKQRSKRFEYIRIKSCI